MQCVRCNAAFVVRDTAVDDAGVRFLVRKEVESLEANPCRVCRKSEVELLGEVLVKPR